MTRSTSRNLTQGVVEHLGLEIVTGRYGPHNKFPIEAELSNNLDVSRSVLREATKMLTAKGLLSARPRQGTKIEPEENWNLLDPDVLRWLLERKFSLDLLLEFTEVRLAIEPMAAAIAARNPSHNRLKPIEEAVHRMMVAEQEHDDPLAADISFHVAVLHASNNKFFIELEDLIKNALKISIRITNRLKAAGNVEDHKKVYDHIVAGNPDAAHDAMDALISEVMDLIVEKKQNETSSDSASAPEPTKAAPS